MTLKDWRISNGLTQQQLAAKLGVRASAISRYEAGRVPEPDIVRKLYRLSDGVIDVLTFYGLASDADSALECSGAAA